MPQLSTRPRDRMGVYKNLQQVPHRHRLCEYEDVYAQRDVWEEYLDWYLVPPRNSESKQNQADRSFRKWSAFMNEERDCHYALATPSDVEQWSQCLLTEYAPEYAQTNWAQIERFYTWLQTHTEHPHVYQPFWMAAADLTSAAHEIWNIKVTRHWEVTE